MVANANISVMSELFSYVLLALFLYSGYLLYDWKTTLLFLAGSLFWTIPLENFGVLMNFFSYSVRTHPTVYPYYLLWIGPVPFWISIGWFDATFPAFQFSKVLVKRGKTLSRAVVGGLIAVNLDLLIDPVAVASGLWLWTHKSFYFLGVPITNYIGWFMLVSLFITVYDKTVVQRLQIGFLKPLERLIWRGLPNLTSFRTLLTVFFVRLIIFQLIFIVTYVPLLMAISSLATMI